MESSKSSKLLERLVSPLGECLTDESARRLLAIKADSTVQARVDELAERHRRGLLTDEEEVEYRSYVSYSTFVAILKSKARQLLARNHGD